MPNANTALITIAYEGSALNDGTMDVRELAPALLAIGDLVSECNRVLNGEKEHIQVKIKSDFRQGSFQINIEIVKNFLDQIMLIGKPLFDIKDILELLGFLGAGKGLVALTKKIKGRKIKKAKQLDDNKVEIFFTDDSETVITETEIYNIFINVGVQDAMQRVVKPLEKDGIDNFYTATNGKRHETIYKEEARYFKEPSYEAPVKSDELIFETEHTGAYNIVTAQFEEGYKWRLSNGQDKINASLEDKEFIRKIDNREVSITKDDIFIVKMKISQWKKPDNSLRTENEITEVVKHMKAETYEQLNIPWEGSAPDDK